MFRIFGVFVLLFCQLLGEVRVKDIAHLQGISDIQIVGYGLVVGLDGTGDKQRTVFTVQSITRMLQQMGVAVDADKSRVKNVAAVMVTAKIPPFSKKGSKIDVQVSSIGDATSLEGGVLVLTPLKGPDNLVYAVAQGPLSIGGMNQGAPRGSRINYELVASIPDGGIIEKETTHSLVEDSYLNLTLNQPDFTTMERLKTAIDERFGEHITYPMDAGLLKIKIPEEYYSNYQVVKLISIIENVAVIPDEIAKVVINERTGTIVVGKNVGISMVSISHNDISLMINENENQDQQNSLSARSIVIPERVNAEELAKALNAIGATPRDMIAIFQSLKRVGALKAELEVM